MNEANIKRLCEELIGADTEDQVIAILTKAGYWDNPEVWRYYDDNENNYSTIGNQQSRPDAAMVEKLVNSVDARLIGECVVGRINPEGNLAPKTIREAVANFFEDNPKSSTAGLIREWDQSKRTEVARGITLSATGAKPGDGLPSFTISDIGEGQTPDTMPDTLLSLTRSNKLRIPFVQGKFNMGGTGALKFCKLQLVVSRRNPKILWKNFIPSDLQWGFTIVRREQPKEGKKSSVYTYLAPQKTNDKNGVLRFNSDSMPLFPVGVKPYDRNSEWGTLIKLYEYNALGFKSHILRRDGLLNRLEVLLPEVALPIRLHECRGYGGAEERSFETTLMGLRVRLDDNRADNLEEGFPLSSAMRVLGENMTIWIYAFKKKKAESYRKNEGILFTVNGQTHGQFTDDFFRRKKVGLSYLADSLLVLVDCTGLSITAREDLFMNSRDRLSGGELRRAIEEELEDILRHNQPLAELRERRRREEIHSKVEDSKPLENILKSLLAKSPTLSKMFLYGDKISNPFKAVGVQGEERPFKGERYPTFFKFKGRDYGTVLRREAHINMRARISFETDAENDYFSRDIDKGISTIYTIIDGNQISYTGDYALNLENGLATLNLQLPPSSKIGEEHNILIRVTDRIRIDPFVNSVIIKVTDEVSLKPSTSAPRRKPPGKEKGVDREITARTQLPKITKVYENAPNGEKGWSDMTPPFNKYSALRIRDSGNRTERNTTNGGSIYDFYVNVDNIFLKTEIKDSGKSPEVFVARFLYGMTLIGISLIHDDLEKEKPTTESEEGANGPEEINIEDQVENITKAIAPVLNPMIDSLGGLDFEVETMGNMAGESV
ncbi:MAG: hypothetical protein WB930_02535 [Syntrophobacteraceae bacterium]